MDFASSTQTAGHSGQYRARFARLATRDDAATERDGPTIAVVHGGCCHGRRQFPSATGLTSMDVLVRSVCHPRLWSLARNSPDSGRILTMNLKECDLNLWNAASPVGCGTSCSDGRPAPPNDQAPL